MTLSDFANKKNLDEKQKQQLETDLEILADMIAACMYNELTEADEND